MKENVMKYIMIAFLITGLVDAKSLHHSNQQIKAKKIIVILKYMDKHGCKMQKKVHEMANIYVRPIFTQTTANVTCATYGRVEGRGCSIPTTSVIPNRPYTCVIGMDGI